MEGNVWPLFVQAVGFLSNLFTSLTAAQKQESPTSSPNAPESAASSTSTSSPTPENGLIKVMRNPAMTTADGVFGDITFNGEWLGVTAENSEDLIKPGIYKARLDKSPHLGYVCPHLQVPERDLAAGGDAGLRVHVANRPSQSKGCIVIGQKVDGDAVDNSQIAFDGMMAVLPQTFMVEIC